VKLLALIRSLNGPLGLLFEPGRKLDWKVTWFGAAEDAVNKGCGAHQNIGLARSVRTIAAGNACWILPDVELSPEVQAAF
jgi:hypothetical protein